MSFKLGRAPRSIRILALLLVTTMVGSSMGRGWSSSSSSGSLAVLGQDVLVVGSDGSLWTYGAGGSTRILSDARSVVAKDDGAIVTKRDGTTVILGEDGHPSSGQLPLGITQLACGALHCLASSIDGRTWTWGANESGQLGDGTRESREEPATIALPLLLRSLAAGRNHSLAIDEGGALFAWGRNASGQLGSKEGDELRPVRVEGLPPLSDVAAGGRHTVALDADRTIWTWGANDVGQLGAPGAPGGPAATRLTGLFGVVAIAAGERHSLALTQAGEVFAWGGNASHEIADTLGPIVRSPVKIAEHATAVAAGNGITAILTADGLLVRKGSGVFTVQPRVTTSPSSHASKPGDAVVMASGAPKTALFVAGAVPLSTADAALNTRLVNLGYSVTQKTGSAALTGDAAGQTVVVISSTVNPAQVTTKFRNVTVPVVTWETGIFANMNMTGTTSGTHFGTRTAQTQVVIATASHPLAGGLTGTATVSTSSTYAWGSVSATGVKVATIVGQTGRAAIFGYETGATMVGLAAPARRVGFFLQDTTSLNASGGTLFDAAIEWASNRPPTVNAGTDQSIVLPATATLAGTASDDGLPATPGALTTTWSKLSGPGTVTFGSAGALSTTATFSAAGSYVLRLTATDGQVSVTDDVAISAAVNVAPTVSAGPDLEIFLPSSATLDGTVTDDGLPTPPAVTVTWSKVSGPGTVTFGNANAIDTTATFSVNGTYVLRLTASDGALSTPDDTTVIVNNPATCLFVVGNTTLGAGDAAIKTRLQNLGLVPLVKSGLQAAAADAAGKLVVVISSTVNPTDVNTRFRDVAVPAVTWESSIFDDMNMTGTTTSDFGTQTTQTQVAIVAATHPLAGGLFGTQTVAASSTFGWGLPSAGGTQVATVVGNATRATIFGYEGGASMVGLPAPARRVGLFLQDTTVLTTAGGTLFDAAINWAVNRPPLVTAGSNQTITLPSNATLAGTANDDGRPTPPGILTTTWSKVSGTGTVTFGDANLVSTTATFSTSGVYVLRLTATDGQTPVTADVTITVNAAANVAPSVSVGPDLGISLPAAVALDGTVSDDELPTPPAVTVTWEKVSGVGTVTFGNANAIDTTATFSVAGTYVLRLTATDGALSTSDDLTVTVTPPNTAPQVSAGPSQAVNLPATANLAGSASDDGLPNPPGAVSVTWSRVSGPGPVIFGDASALVTSASFSQAGTYVLRLTAIDGAASAFSDLTVTVTANLVFWTNLVDASASGGSITKTGSQMGWTAGAASVDVIRDGYGYVEFTVPDTTNHHFCGLSNGDSSADYTDVDFALHPQAGGALNVYESGTYRGTFGTYSGGDRLRVEVRFGVVRYLRNGTVLYTSSVRPTYPLRADMTLYQPGSTLLDARMGNIVWSNETGVSIVDSTLTSATSSGGASSANALESGEDGYMVFTATNTTTDRIAGLGVGDTGIGANDVDFGIKLGADGIVSVTENGVLRGSFGSYDAGDYFRVAVRSGIVEYKRNDVLLHTSATAPTYPLRVDTALLSPLATVADVKLESVTWTASEGVYVDGNSLKKIGTSSGWDTGGGTTAEIALGDAFMEFIALESNTRRVAGLDSGPRLPSGNGYADIDFGIELGDTGTVKVVESGVVRGTFGSYGHGDRVRVEVQDGVLRYRRNGTVFYTSSLNPAYPLHTATRLYDPGATVAHVTVGDLVWMNEGNVEVAGNGLRKSLAAPAGWNAGAVGTRGVNSGYVEMTAWETNTDRMFGLSHGDRSPLQTDIDFALYFASNTSVHVYESGTYRGTFGALTPGDRLRVEVVGGVVRYSSNSVVFYTSAVAPVLPLRADASLYTPGASLLALAMVGPSAVDQVEVPLISPPSGTYSDVQSVTITALGGSTIRYTRDGSDPTGASAAYTGPVVVDQSGTVKAKAFRTGWTSSAVSAETYTLVVPTPTLNPGTGTFSAPQNVVVVCAAPGATIGYTTSGVDPTTSDPTIASGGSIPVSQNTTVKARAWATGWTTSGVAIAALDFKVATPTFSPAGGAGVVYNSAQNVTVSTATPGPVSIHYTTNGLPPTQSDPQVASGGTVSVSATTVLRAMAWKSTWATSDLAQAHYRIDLGTVATPSMSPVPGSYTSATAVTLSSATSATVRYTIDGTDPTPASPIYTAPITVETTRTLKARAYKLDWTPSAVATGQYILNLGRVSTPTLSPAIGRYATVQQVTVTTATAGATIHYTTSGADPTEGDPVVASGASVTVDRSMWLKVKAWKTGETESTVGGGEYWITGAVAAGSLHTLVLRSNGVVFAWGLNQFGELGDGTTTTRTSPVSVLNITNVAQVAAGNEFSLALKKDGTVWSWGWNGQGQLGTGGAPSSTATPIQVTSLSEVVTIAAGGSYALAAKSDGSVWVWGEVPGWFGYTYAPVQLGALSGITSIAGHAAAGFALKTDGTVSGSLWAWGGNSLGDGTSLSSPTVAVRVALSDVAAMAARSTGGMALTPQGTVWSWGQNYLGDVGDGTTVPRLAPVQVPGLTNVIAVAAGTNHNLALTSTGRVAAWGYNLYGQLGDESTTTRTLPVFSPIWLPFAVAVSGGGDHTVVLSREGEVWVWGRNDFGQLGIGNTTPKVYPVRVSGFSAVEGTWRSSDVDGDGLSYYEELALGTDVLNADTNGDGLSDLAAVRSGRSATNFDMDGDGVLNATELVRGTDPFRADTDGDGVGDATDAFPLDPTRWNPPAPVPGDTTPPVITLTEPTNAVLIP